MNKLEKQWALEYSTQQDCFNVDLLDLIIKKNRYGCINKNSNDYQIVFIGTRDECSEMYYYLKQLQSGRN